MIFRVEECLLKFFPRQLAQEVAVIGNHAYLIGSERAFPAFPSGPIAIAIPAEQCGILVVDDIQRDDKQVGSVVRFLLETLHSYNLPP